MKKNSFLLSLLLAICAINASGVEKVRNDVPNRGFYKDVLFDCSIGLTTRDTLASFKKLNMSCERVAFDSSNDAPSQNRILAGDSEDWNGHLLYPDGEPRFKMIFVAGGSSLVHGSSLGEAGRRRIREFYNAGGSYVGTCAGSIIASRGYVSSPNVPSYFGIWPGIFVHTDRAHISTGIKIENKSPLLKYSDFGGDKYVDSVNHNQGNYAQDLPKGAEVLARYDYKAGGKMHNQPVIVAYKTNAETGRMVLCGSHPEGVQSGERLDLAAAMLSYAIEGVGMTKVKGYLNKGEIRNMDRESYERVPEYTRIGDLQCHHFAVEIPQGARDVTFELNGADGSHMSLAVCKETFAYDDCADYISTMDGAHQKFTLPKPKAGLWYVCVKCLDTPEVTNTSTGHVYAKTAVNDLLNGVPYSIVVDWK